MQESELIQQASSKRVLFLGEWIDDVYHYVKPLGRPTKDAILSVLVERTETFTGGVVAAANHARALCGEVRSASGGRLYRKERYVEGSHFHKLFQSYTHVSTDSSPQARISLLGPPDSVEYTLDDWDTVVVCDYGHGMVDDAFIERLSTAKYLAVNVQTNSENYGFNLATKYSKAHFLCVDEPEARLATQNRVGPIQDSLMGLAKISNKVCITLGKAGAIGYSKEDGIVHVPAFTEKVVDTMGAGDAFFAVTAAVAEQADIRSILRIGNAAGALASNIIGHRSSITKEALIEQLALHP